MATINNVVIPEATFVDGGGLYDGWKGGNRSKWHSEKELKACLLEDFKKAGIKASVRFNRAGWLTSITVTMKIRADEILSYDEFKKNYHLKTYGWIDYYDPDTGRWEHIYNDCAYALDKNDPTHEKICRSDYDLRVKSLTDRTYHRSDVDVLNKEANARFDLLLKIVESYNKDCSNGMIDYFDRDIYDSYAFKIA